MSNKVLKYDASPLFLSLVKRDGLPAPVREHRFAIPERAWRFDYAWISHRVALEVEGGAFTRGRHTRGKGFLEDMVKYNNAALRGWRVLRVTPDQLTNLDTIAMLKRALTSA